MATKRRSLTEYRRKRDFTKSPEPTGAVRGAKSKSKANRKKMAQKKILSKQSWGIFCVQKHLATRLHYDFRLEHNGTLLSWAVPKGPSVNPKDKRLAMRVEDHPIDYADFEGVIPEGYGMGVVLVWDRGSWIPLDKDVDAAIKSGNLKFELRGVKLKGTWALVRTRRNDESGEPWLLIKKTDHWSAAVDITELAPKSVKSKGDFEDILKKKNPAIWKSNKSNDSGSISASAKTILTRLKKLRAGT